MKKNKKVYIMPKNHTFKKFVSVLLIVSLLTGVSIKVTDLIRGTKAQYSKDGQRKYKYFYDVMLPNGEKYVVKEKDLYDLINNESMVCVNGEYYSNISNVLWVVEADYEVLPENMSEENSEPIVTREYIEPCVENEKAVIPERDEDGNKLVKSISTTVVAQPMSKLF